jgi:hypothetical protein
MISHIFSPASIWLSLFLAVQNIPGPLGVCHSRMRLSLDFPRDGRILRTVGNPGEAGTISSILVSIDRVVAR